MRRSPVGNPGTGRSLHLQRVAMTSRGMAS